MENIRYDKPWHECMTLSELKAIVDDPAARPTALSVRPIPTTPQLAFSRFPPCMIAQKSSHERYMDFPCVQQKKRGRNASSESSDEARPTSRSGPAVQRVRVVDSFKVPTAAEVTRMNDMLDEMEFCVIGDCEMNDEHGGAASSEDSSQEEDRGSGKSCTGGPQGKRGRLKQEDVQRMIVQHGGKVLMTPRPGSLVIAPHGKLLRVAHLIHGGRFDIISCKWLVRCVKKGVLSPPGYHDYIFMTEETRQRWAKQADAFGDAYNERVTTRELRRTMSRMPKSGKSQAWRDMAASRLEHDELAVLTGRYASLSRNLWTCM